MTQGLNRLELSNCKACLQEVLLYSVSLEKLKRRGSLWSIHPDLMTGQQHVARAGDVSHVCLHEAASVHVVELASRLLYIPPLRLGFPACL